MINLCENHPAEVLWICSYLNNKDRLQVRLANQNLYKLLEPLFNSLAHYVDYQNKVQSVEEEKTSLQKILEFLDADCPKFVTQYQECKIQLDNAIAVSKIAFEWKNYNHSQLTHHYNPRLIPDYPRAMIHAYCLELKVKTVETAIRISAAAKTNQITIDLFKLLCCNVNTLDERSLNGNTALHWAIKSNNQNFAYILLDKGANCKIANWNRETPLHFAALLNTDNLVESLLSNKADLDAKDRDGKTALDWALSKNKTACISRLKGVIPTKVVIKTEEEMPDSLIW